MKPRRPQVTADGRKHAPVGHGAKTETVREQAIVALLSQPTITEAAAICGVGERTLRRWLARNQSAEEVSDAEMALGSIRTRVERLASAWPPSPETVFVCMEQSDERCPACAYD